MSEVISNNLTTTLQPFAQYGSSRAECVMAVQPGVPILDALEYSTCYLSSVRALAQARAQTDESMYATINLIEAAQAIINSVCSALMKEKNHV